jgi:hypothetical protein
MIPYNQLLLEHILGCTLETPDRCLKDRVHLSQHVPISPEVNFSNARIDREFDNHEVKGETR